ncbi:MAG: PIN domain-containing protein [Spirochaetota bacterium]|nr:PIN domain-containing protein [Spirochaetota bacterium]
MYLVDTNMFLEILLQQDKSKDCKSFLNKNIGSLNISDFSFHSIGIILFKNNDEKIFLKFISDILPNTNLVYLPQDDYKEVINIKQKIKLDFDDSYQYSLCRRFELKLITVDHDFKRVKDIDTQFL